MTQPQTNYQGGYKHQAEIKCWSCTGAGEVEGYTCGICMGRKTITAGCGGPAETDLSYPGMTYCVSEGRFVPPEEVS